MHISDHAQPVAQRVRLRAIELHSEESSIVDVELQELSVVQVELLPSPVPVAYLRDRRVVVGGSHAGGMGLYL